MLQFWITSSGLAYAPSPVFPIYCPTKTAVHSFLVGLRAALVGTDVSVISIVPPLVGRTGLGHREKLDLATLPIAMALEDFTNNIFKALEENPVKELKEVDAGTAVT